MRTTLGVGNASESAKGIVELATNAETISGSSFTLAIHPMGAAAAFHPVRRSIINWSATTYTFGVSDENKYITLSNAAAITVTLPANTTAVPIGAEAEFLWLGVGQPSFVAGCRRHRQLAQRLAQNLGPGCRRRRRRKKINTNDWIISGDLAA